MMAHAFQNQDWQVLNVLVALALGLRSTLREDRVISAWGLREYIRGGECPVVAGTEAAGGYMMLTRKPRVWMGSRAGL